MLKGAGRATGAPCEPLINIFTNEATFNYAIRNYFGGSGSGNAGADSDTLGDPGSSERLWLCQTASGAPVDPHDLVVAALIGRVRRVVTDEAGRVINLGRSSRFFTGAAREAVLLSGDRCCWPGCEQRGEFLQIDHLTPFNGPAGGRGGGETNTHNGGPMCGPHNRAKHGGRFTVKRDRTGWHHFRPDGTEIAPRD